MQNILHNRRIGEPLDSPGKHADIHDAPRLRVATGEAVFRAGDARQAYRVTSGAVCHFSAGADGGGGVSVIEHAFPGDLIGVGYLPTHSSTAMAMVDTVVTPVSRADVDRALLSDNALSYRLAAAAERDFEFLRAKTVRVTSAPATAAEPGQPVERVANYLLAVLGATRGERGAGDLSIPEDIASGFVADQLRMNIDTLAMALLTLRRSGILDLSERGVRVVDMARLEAIAEAS